MAGGYLRVDQNQVMGSPIKADQVIGRDILGRLFDNILFGESFNRWRLGTDNLQLRLYGGPGTGKTTFVAVAAQHLREHGSTAVTIFIQPHYAWDHNTLRDILHCVLSQLVSYIDTHDDPGSYLQESTSDIRERMQKIVAKRLMEPNSLFLLVDGSDSNNVRFHQSLEHELSELQKLGVKILVTSRHNLPLETSFFYLVFCDFCDTEVDPDDRILDVFWECTQKHTACSHCYSNFPISNMCTNEDHGCNNQRDRRMVHPYKYSLIDMNTALRSRMKEFICWNLENEHGDLGLGSSSEKSGIPLSKLGLELRERESSNTTRAIVDKIEQNAEGNVAMARLRLDILHGLQDVDSIEERTGITPSDVTAIFNLAFNSTQHAAIPPPQRKLALKAMAIVSQVDYYTGVSFETIHQVIKLSESRPGVSDPGNGHSEDEVALATKGLLSFRKARRSPLGAYSQAFHTYLREDNQLVKEMVVKLESVLERSGKSWESLAEREEFERHEEFEEDIV